MHGDKQSKRCTWSYITGEKNTQEKPHDKGGSGSSQNWREPVLVVLGVQLVQTTKLVAILTGNNLVIVPKSEVLTFDLTEPPRGRVTLGGLGISCENSHV